MTIEKHQGETSPMTHGAHALGGIEKQGYSSFEEHQPERSSPFESGMEVSGICQTGGALGGVDEMRSDASNAISPDTSPGPPESSTAPGSHGEGAPSWPSGRDAFKGKSPS